MQPRIPADDAATPLLVALDIETDTSGGGGLDPRLARVVAVALAFSDGRRVLVDDDDESELLRRLDGLLRGVEGFLVTWNGSGFDLPFLAERYRQNGLHLGPAVWQDDSLMVKYPPLDGLIGPVSASWGRLEHVDIAPMWRRFAERMGVDWGLKAVARASGLNPIEVDRSKIHLLSLDDLAAYALSDVEVTLDLALRLDSSALSQAVAARSPF